MSASLVGSEMCIRDSTYTDTHAHAHRACAPRIRTAGIRIHTHTDNICLWHVPPISSACSTEARPRGNLASMC
eukprot:13574601-Alexandrium_andersonii.AAC.1